MGSWTGTIPTLSAATAPSAAQLKSITDALAALTGAWTSYTPTWKSSGTQPAVGNGTISGIYNLADNLLWVNVSLTIGSTSTFGTGFYTFTLPAGLTSLTHTRVSGIGHVLDTSTQTHYLMSVQRADDDEILGRLHNVGTSSGIPTSASPVTLATGDVIQLTAHLELT